MIGSSGTQKNLLHQLRNESMNAKQLKNLITEILQHIHMYSDVAVDQLMLTAAQESRCGHYLYQLNGGPARGIFQMEPATMEDIYKNYLIRKPLLAIQVDRLVAPGSLILNLTGNILFQIALARVHYWRVKEPLPFKQDDEFEYVRSLAQYWKTYWNTSAGQGTVNEAIQNYNYYVREGAH